MTSCGTTTTATQPSAAQHEERDGCVRPRNEKVDPRVIDSPHPWPDARSPPHAVVKSARPETCGNRRRKRGSGKPSPRTVRSNDQKRCNNDGDEEHRLM